MKFNTLPSSIAVLVAASTITLAQDYTCSKDKPCASGCCRIEPDGNGSCGLGNTFCAPGNCTSGCDSKAECNPGWDPKYSLAQNCPLNVCCGQYGFCGTTSDFCGNATVQRPSCTANTTSGRTIGYYEGWSMGKPCQQVSAQDIPLGYYTHINFGFVLIDPKTFEMAEMDENTAKQYDYMKPLKARQPGLQTWASIGGWSFSDPNTTTATTFSDLAASADHQQSFFKSLIAFTKQYDFDGVDIDWEYPTSAERNGRPEDLKNLVTLLQNLRHALDVSGSPKRIGLSITIPASYYYLQGFDIVGIAPSIDWFNVMTYDLHGTWDKTKLAYAHTNLTEIEQSLDLLWRNNIDPLKVNMGLGFYGRSFTLADNTTCTGAGCPWVSGGVPGACTNASGILGATEIKTILLDPNKNVSVTLDSNAAVQIAQWDKTQWISYDDITSFQMKLRYANSKCLGGSLIWAVDLDVDGSMAEATAAAGHIDRQYVTDGTLDYLQGTSFVNATLAPPKFSNSSVAQTSAAAPASSAVDEDECDDGMSTSPPVTSGQAASTGATVIASSSAATSAAPTSSAASTAAAPATTGSVAASAVSASMVIVTSSAMAATTAPVTSAAPAASAVAAGGASGAGGAKPTAVQSNVSSSCSAWYMVQKGDGCANIATAMKVELKDFYSWNPDVKSDCSGLMTGFFVCVGVSPSAATTITTPLPVPSASS